MSGIFRDVYLLKRPEEFVRDYRVTTVLGKQSAELSISVAYWNQPVETAVSVYDRDRLAAYGKVWAGRVLLEIEDPKLWNAEQPNLYTLVIETEHETITDCVGIRSIEIRDRVLYLNGQKVKLHGVNRHDSDPVTGPCIGIEQLMQDLTMMKQYNVNAIRSSHYPNAPYFYQLCDKYGFMVMDEADIEAHGPFMLYYKEDGDYHRFKRWNEKIADDPVWGEAILDRVQLMVEREKNRPCILMWSMGNESAYGCNFERALRWTKEFDPGRITHYESARYRNYDRIYDYENLDLYSRMYPAIWEIETYLQEDASKPFLLVEYCHSMGNGPGDLEDYFELVHEEDRMCGGFVWEWCDHAVYAGEAENGKTRYLYGGDHGEEIHDGNFCMDGLVYPDRTAHTGLLEYKNVHRPVRVISYDVQTGELRLRSYMDFIDLKDYITVSYEVNCDGVCVDAGSIPDVPAAPHGETVVELDVTIPRTGSVYLKLIYRLLYDSPLVPAGHVLGFDELLLPNEDGRNQTAARWLNQEIDVNAVVAVTETDTKVIMRGTYFVYTYSKKTGLFESINYAGREYLDRPMELNLWRAPTDNDRYIRQEWERACYNRTRARAYDTVVRPSKDGISIASTMSVSADAIQRILDIKAFWNIDNNGGICVSLEVKKNREFPELPRFGVRLFLDRRLEQASYYGYGPAESYRDKHRAASHGLYHADVRRLHEDYLRPQENGSHCDCDYVELNNGQFGLAAVSDEKFSFNASVYAQEELEKKAHNFELEESGSTVLCIDYAQNGIGSNSCGPKVMEKYCFDGTEFCFRFKLVPFVKSASTVS